MKPRGAEGDHEAAMLAFDEEQLADVHQLPHEREPAEKQVDADFFNGASHLPCPSRASGA